MNFAVIYKIVLRILTIITIAFAVSMGVAIIYSESLTPFLFSTLISVTLLLIFLYLNKGKEISDIGRRETYLTVSLAWFLISVVGALPFLFSGHFLSVTDALFESVSGFTTTGSSILTDIEALPKSILFWRSLTHWIGGIGIIVLVIIIMPSLKIGNYSLFSAESSLQDKLVPRIKSVVKRLLLIYVGLTTFEAVLLILGGMDLFDSVCHSFGTIATGGFSTKNDSIAGYSPYVQYVVTLFMILAGTNFGIHYFIVKRNFGKIKYNEELKIYLSIIFSVSILITFILYFDTSIGLETAFRESLFQVTSIVTCTGFATTDYLIWPTVAWVIIFLLMFVGGSTGSTAGGIKVARHIVAFKNIKKIFFNLMHPRTVYTITLNRKRLTDNNNSSILAFVLWYILLFIIGSVFLVLTGLDYETSISAIATAMGGIGPGIGKVGPVSNFAHITSVAKLIIIFFMILGRLELYAVLILFTPSFWKKV
jgi:trk system potassium uptake protein TrkH